MSTFVARGLALRSQAKELILEFMKNCDLCQPGRDGLRQSELFRECGFDWGPYANATSSNQQYWLVALLR